MREQKASTAAEEQATAAAEAADLAGVLRAELAAVKERRDLDRQYAKQLEASLYGGGGGEQGNVAEELREAQAEVKVCNCALCLLLGSRVRCCCPGFTGSSFLPCSELASASYLPLFGRLPIPAMLYFV